MSITLSDGITTVNLHKDLFWSDEYNWAPVEQSVDRSITGALIIQAAGRQYGRPITLEPENDSSAWMKRSVIDALRNWAAEPGKELTLTLRSVSRTVIFRHQDGGLEVSPVIHYDAPVNDDWYLATIRLMEVEAGATT